jgi:hypothetical protein
MTSRPARPPASRWPGLFSATTAPLALLLLTRLALGFAYSLTIPVWEAYDEDGHFAYARYLAVHRTLLQLNDPEVALIWEKFQPPLYYLLTALALPWLDLGERWELPERNPYLANGNAGVNYALHPLAPGPAGNQIVLAVYLARALTVVLSTGSVIFMHLGARRIWPRAPNLAWTTTCLYAFWPQFLFIGGVITNDALVTSLSAVIFYLTVELTLNGFRLQRAWLLSLALGAAALTKLNALALIPAAGGAVLLGLTSRNWRSPRWWLALAGGGVVLAAAVWALSSLEFVTAQVFQIETLREFLSNAPSIDQSGLGGGPALAALRYGFVTFLASYGWGNLEIYRWMYWLWAIGAALALLGLISGAVRRKFEPARLRLVLLMALQIASLAVSALALAIAHQSIYLVPGRYLLPALPAVSGLLVAGWWALIPARFQTAAWKGLSAGLLLVGWSVPSGVLLPAYAPPPALRSEKVDHPLRYAFGEQIELIGYLQPASAAPGRDWTISLCWNAAAPVAQNLSVFLELIGPDGKAYGHLETYPGRGNYPTSRWAVNTPVCDPYTLSLSQDVPAPSAARLKVSLLNGVRGQPLAPALDIPVKVRATEKVPALAQPVNYRFANGIALKGYEIQTLSGDRRGALVRLRWEALEDVQENITIFVHLRDNPLNAYAQGDSPPRNGWYPTSFWGMGEAVLDEHTLLFPDETPPPLSLYVGLYDPITNARVPVVDAQGRPAPNHEIILAQGLTFP